MLAVSCVKVHGGFCFLTLSAASALAFSCKNFHESGLIFVSFSVLAINSSHDSQDLAFIHCEDPEEVFLNQVWQQMAQQMREVFSHQDIPTCKDNYGHDILSKRLAIASYLKYLRTIFLWFPWHV